MQPSSYSYQQSSYTSVSRTQGNNAVLINSGLTDR